MFLLPEITELFSKLEEVEISTDNEYSRIFFVHICIIYIPKNIKHKNTSYIIKLKM